MTHLTPAPSAAAAEPSPGGGTTVTDRQLGALLAVTLPHLATDPHVWWPLTSIQLTYDGRELWAAGTDRYTLAVARTTVLGGGSQPWEVCLPHTDAARLIAACPDVDAEQAARRAAEVAAEDATADEDEDEDEVVPDYPPRPTTRITLTAHDGQLRVDTLPGHRLHGQTARQPAATGPRTGYVRWRDLVARALAQPPRPLAGTGISPRFARWAAIRDTVTLCGLTPALGPKPTSAAILLTARVDTVGGHPVHVLGLHMPETGPPITAEDLHTRWAPTSPATGSPATVIRDALTHHQDTARIGLPATPNPTTGK